MRWLAILIVTACRAQPWNVDPAIAQQGDTIRLRAGSAAVSARMAGRTVRLFPEPDGGRSGLMPVPALLDPDSYEFEFLDSAGGVLHSTSITVRNAHFPRQNIRIGKAVLALKPAPGEMETMEALRNTVTDVRHWDEPFVPPVSGCLTSRYGVRRLHNGKLTGNYHSGVDHRASAGEPIHAVASGTVRVARIFNIHGGTIGIDHGQGVTSAYLHMSSLAVAERAALRKGDVIGYVGSTGRSTGPHLHWSLAVNGVHVNPQQWMALKPCSSRAILRSNGRHPRR
ncbi:MAG TPA: M23 family metallopeptidase [Bryobacteraceae bacterium]|nr:M23 family metallopeptidase [Bryobacteraceae bacterium]